jgi:hypothetical protein
VGEASRLDRIAAGKPFPPDTNTKDNRVIKNGVSGRQPRRAAFREAQHTDQYVSIHESAAQRRITACDAVFQYAS